ncbi:hypothetical protein C9374_003006 [Naegleria lovaniensis]|uniref:FZ domain-containing protein n=1 Tax=Naegleria lovaniensis TaxID=51637 RepID=A0AA88KPY3_NAELO|nr:uncharacterized protein C9374_003006 [Naegleria lovaniensis]KAG2385857.1 hypothetical protein C9374_003006 [Naegleria lovaniensis]
MSSSSPTVLSQQSVPHHQYSNHDQNLSTMIEPILIPPSISDTKNDSQNSTMLCITLPNYSSSICGFIGFNVTLDPQFPNYTLMEQHISDEYKRFYVEIYQKFTLNETSTACNHSILNFICSSNYKRCFKDVKPYDVCDSVCREVFTSCFPEAPDDDEQSLRFLAAKEYCGKPTKPIYPSPPLCTNIMNQTQNIIVLVSLIALLLFLIIVICIGGFMSFCYYRRQAQRERYSSLGH